MTTETLVKLALTVRIAGDIVYGKLGDPYIPTQHEAVITGIENDTLRIAVTDHLGVRHYTYSLGEMSKANALGLWEMVRPLEGVGPSLDLTTVPRTLMNAWFKHAEVEVAHG